MSQHPTVRPWWRPPRNPTEPHVGRAVSFLELFFDLVYVVLVAELAHTLAQHPTPLAALHFIFLFTVTWWSWFNGSVYHDLHSNNDLRTRVFVFLQMFAVGGMAVFAHHAIGEGATGFALSYAALQLILAYLWWRTGVHDTEHRVLSQPYAVTSLLSGILYVVSVFLPATLRYGAWVAGLFISMLAIGLVFWPQSEAAKRQVQQILHFSPAMIERIGLLMILVLAEVIGGAIRGVAAAEHLTFSLALLGFLGMLLAALLWWLYFDFVSHQSPRPQLVSVLVWSGASLLGTTAAAATGSLVLSTIEHAIKEPDHAVSPLLPLFVAALVLSIALTIWSLKLRDTLRPWFRRVGLLMGVIALLISQLAWLHLSPLAMFLSLLALLSVPLAFGLVIWFKEFGASDAHALHEN